LKTMPDGRAALADIETVASDLNQKVLCGAFRMAARRFFEWANGDGSWSTLDPETKDNLVRYIPKVCLEYHAQVSEKTPLVAYRPLTCPTLLLQGEHSHEPLRLISQKLAHAMRRVSLQTVYGAGHMGPFSDSAVVAEMMADHIAAAEDRLPRGSSVREAAACAA